VGTALAVNGISPIFSQFAAKAAPTIFRDFRILLYEHDGKLENQIVMKLD